LFKIRESDIADLHRCVRLGNDSYSRHRWLLDLKFVSSYSC
jgi:hypothetical protein